MGPLSGTELGRTASPTLVTPDTRPPAQARAFIARLFRVHRLPDFLIIGAQKAGTTSLASYLAAHPSVLAPAFKEVHYFDSNYTRGTEWYRSHFPIGARRRLGTRFHGRRLRAFDATPYYLMHPQVPLRASRLIPAARIIVLLRDPVDRAYSHYHHEVRLGFETLTFEQAIEAEPARIAGELQKLDADPSYAGFNYQHFTYLERGIYSVQIRRWLNYYRPDQILILSSEQFFQSPAAEYRKVLKFLDLPPWELPSYPAEHVGKYPPMSATVRSRLREYYAPRNRALRDELNSTWPGSGDAIVSRFSA
jgi:sulfotransferase family protein